MYIFFSLCKLRVEIILSMTHWSTFYSYYIRTNNPCHLFQLWVPNEVVEYNENIILNSTDCIRILSFCNSEFFSYNLGNITSIQQSLLRPSFNLFIISPQACSENRPFHSSLWFTHLVTLHKYLFLYRAKGCSRISIYIRSW